MYAILDYFFHPALQSAGLAIEPESLSRGIIEDFLIERSNDAPYQKLLAIYALLSHSGYIQDPAVAGGMAAHISPTAAQMKQQQPTKMLLDTHQIPPLLIPVHLLDAQQMYDEYTLNQKVIDKIMTLMHLADAAPIPIEMGQSIIEGLLQRNKALAENTELRFSEKALSAESARIDKLLAKMPARALDNCSKVSDELFQKIFNNRSANKLAMKAFIQAEKTVTDFLAEHTKTKQLLEHNKNKPPIGLRQ